MSNNARFWAHVIKGKRCWEWTGTLNSSGYGAFWSEAGYGAHRASYLFATGAIPAGLHILHSCDNRRCVRPSHLRAGTHLENMQDKVRRHRSGVGITRKQTPKWFRHQPPLPVALAWCAGASDAIELGQFNNGNLSNAVVYAMQLAHGVATEQPRFYGKRAYAEEGT